MRRVRASSALIFIMSLAHASASCTRRGATTTVLMTAESVPQQLKGVPAATWESSTVPLLVFCSWVIVPAHNENAVELNFTRFSTTPGYNFVKVYEKNVSSGVGTPLGGALSGSITTLSYRSGQGKALVIVLQTEGYKSALDLGFWAN